MSLNTLSLSIIRRPKLNFLHFIFHNKLFSLTYIEKNQVCSNHNFVTIILIILYFNQLLNLYHNLNVILYMCELHLKLII